ncbi:ATP-grasp domain-containing protein [Candidatus Symbiobacter mobilis]|uniref:ATP-grasp domain-containing protein n=1 Tax=Candidatus Symbiobacter mobilis CR TaxID=946483 RepID=U5NBI3_9BURK|nr:hypothetical protein [Candidatus Symbiobacter mobilis]AGX88680.1 hypothetical protein Cenrod_2630 [Candidatus Symbiobacter mobilis CR]
MNETSPDAITVDSVPTDTFDPTDGAEAPCSTGCTAAAKATGPAASAESATSFRAEFVGLAPFLRASIAGVDLRPLGEDALTQVQADPTRADRWMNLSTIMLCLGQQELGLTLQKQALQLQRIYFLPAKIRPARYRLLMLMMPGDLAANTPLDCLLEHSDVDLIYYFLGIEEPFPEPLPDHDALLVAMSESDENLAHLEFLEGALAQWPRPVLNLPRHIPRVDRALASNLLQGIPGLLMPPTLRVPRERLVDLCQGRCALPDLGDLVDQAGSGSAAGGMAFPIILRPVGSQAGKDLERFTAVEEIPAYLDRVADTHFFLSPFVDYRHADGTYRKMRIALIEGQTYACHMAVSDHWMVHYINAGMYQEAWKREQELAFMEQFERFQTRHHEALAAIARAVDLDYVCIDCAETPDGRLLVFELDHAMIVHAMDSEELFPYKQIHMQKVRDAFRDMLLRRQEAFLATAAQP